MEKQPGMGIDEFAQYWRRLIRRIKTCEFTEKDSKEVLMGFERTVIQLTNSKPYGWFNHEIDNYLGQLRNELHVALKMAESNYRKGYGKTKIVVAGKSIEAIGKFIKEILRKITLPY